MTARSCRPRPIGRSAARRMKAAGRRMVMGVLPGPMRAGPPPRRARGARGPARSMIRRLALSHERPVAVEQVLERLRVDRLDEVMVDPGLGGAATVLALPVA